MNALARLRAPKALLAVWILLIIFTSSYWRLRAGEGAPTLDWLIATQLGLCTLAAVLAAPRMASLGGQPGVAGAIVGYLAAVAVTIPASVTPGVSLGYFVLLAAGMLSTLAIGGSSQSRDEVLAQELLLSVILGFCLLKDVILALTISQDDSNTGRLGMGLTSANSLSLLAAVVFLMSLGRSGRWLPRLALQCLCVLVIAMSESRGSAISLLVGLAVYAWMRTEDSTRRASVLKAGLICLGLSGVLMVSLLLWTYPSADRSAARDFSRNSGGQSMEELTTGRTDVWTTAVAILRNESLEHLLLGNGYGLSRIVLNEDNRDGQYYFKHAHDTVLESLIAVGLVGTAGLATLCAITLLVLLRGTGSRADPFVCRGTAVIWAIFATFPTEAYLSMKLSFMHFAFVFYLSALPLYRDALTASRLAQRERLPFLPASLEAREGSGSCTGAH